MLVLKIDQSANLGVTLYSAYTRNPFNSVQTNIVTTQIVTVLITYDNLNTHTCFSRRSSNSKHDTLCSIVV